LIFNFPIEKKNVFSKGNPKKVFAFGENKGGGVSQFGRENSPPSAKLNDIGVIIENLKIFLNFFNPKDVNILFFEKIFPKRIL
jgi:hypothetical protein